MKGLMIQGTSSDAGKSFLVTGLCRLLADRGVRVCPFKSQNMSNNACVTWDGREMSRAQAVQAEAARLRPETFMNPILLKPRTGTSSEIVLDGRVQETPRGGSWNDYRTFAQGPGIRAVRRALQHIGENFDAVIIEGAGSPAEVNLNDAEIVNMRVAREADVPVALVTDVDRGGSLASIVGTLELLGADRDRVKGIIFNKFRGDVRLFESAVRWVEEYTGVKVLGVMPWVEGAAIAGEDSLSLRWNREAALDGLSLGVVRFPSVANFTDLDPLEMEPDVSLIALDAATPPRTLDALDAVILPGTKNTMQDMAWLHRTGLAESLRKLSASGRFVLGLCGGYQMLGCRLLDPELRENGELKETDGLGLLPAVTDFRERPKRTAWASGTLRPEFSPQTVPVSGYEIHFGQTTQLTHPREGERRCVGRLCRSEASSLTEAGQTTQLTHPRDESEVLPLFELEDGPEGLAWPDLSVAGTYLHGILECDRFRTLWLNAVRASRGLPERPVTDTRAMKEAAFDALAAAVREHLDVEAILKLIEGK
ncbi:MAG: cobyric acid synthase [Fretibacterium sp.]|nr:cobyric acid synthase [Fretibacterium sp.]